MTHEERWQAILSRITAAEPVNLDEPQGKPPSPPAPGTDQAHIPPSAALWQDDDDENPEYLSFIGIRVSQPLDNIPAIATRLASAALERRTVPVILSELPASGFEPFGFRVERLQGSADDIAGQLADLQAFWNMPVVIDAAQVTALG